MSDLFGGPARLVHEVAIRNPGEDAAFVRQRLREMKLGEDGLLRVYHPSPTAAFSTRDQSSEGYAAAVRDMETRGFAPVLRGPGGRLVVYDESALVIDLIAPHPEPRHAFIKRFEAVTELLVEAFRALGLDARSGSIADEFCPGTHSVNLGGRTKIAGLAQRLGKGGYHLGVVITAGDVSPARDAMTSAYAKLGLKLDPKTVGSIKDETSDVAIGDVQTSITERLCRMIKVEGALPSFGGLHAADS